MNLSLGSKTDPGRRSNNEDFVLAIDGSERNLSVRAVLIVADGMGGRKFGEKASETAVTVASDVLGEMLAEPKGRDIPIQDALGTALRKANSAVYELAHEIEGCEGMGTTCVIAILTEERLFVGHAGDSRAYLIRGQQIDRVTDDHSFVAEQVRAGTITEEHARRSKFRNVITRAVGIEPTIEPDIVEFAIADVEAILLCTDGLTNEMDESEIERVLLRAATPQDAADRFIEIVNKRGGRDNITALVARLGEGAIAPAESEEDVAAEEEFFQPERKRKSSPSRDVLLPVLTIALVLFAVAAVYFGQMLSGAGYDFVPSPPFVVKHPPPPAPPAPTYIGLTYNAPATVPNIPPVMDEPLIRNPKTGDISVVTVEGALLTVTRDGAVESKAALPRVKASSITDSGPQSAYAVDEAGNVYVADPSLGTLIQLDNEGHLLSVVAKTGLKRPTAIAIDDDGSIFVIDGGRLKVIHTATSTPTPAH